MFQLGTSNTVLNWQEQKFHLKGLGLVGEKKVDSNPPLHWWHTPPLSAVPAGQMIQSEIVV